MYVVHNNSCFIYLYKLIRQRYLTNNFVILNPLHTPEDTARDPTHTTTKEAEVLTLY